MLEAKVGLLPRVFGYHELISGPVRPSESDGSGFQWFRVIHSLEDAEDRAGGGSKDAVQGWHGPYHVDLVGRGYFLGRV